MKRGHFHKRNGRESSLGVANSVRKVLAHGDGWMAQRMLSARNLSAVSVLLPAGPREQSDLDAAHAELQQPHELERAQADPHGAEPW